MYIQIILFYILSVAHISHSPQPLSQRRSVAQNSQRYKNTKKKLIVCTWPKLWLLLHRARFRSSGYNFRGWLFAPRGCSIYAERYKFLWLSSRASAQICFTPKNFWWITTLVWYYISAISRQQTRPDVWLSAFSTMHIVLIICLAQTSANKYVLHTKLHIKW